MTSAIAAIGTNAIIVWVVSASSASNTPKRERTVRFLLVLARVPNSIMTNSPKRVAWSGTYRCYGSITSANLSVAPVACSHMMRCLIEAATFHAKRSRRPRSRTTALKVARMANKPGRMNNVTYDGRRHRAAMLSAFETEAASPMRPTWAQVRRKYLSAELLAGNSEELRIRQSGQFRPRLKHSVQNSARLNRNLDWQLACVAGVDRYAVAIRIDELEIVMTK